MSGVKAAQLIQTINLNVKEGNKTDFNDNVAKLPLAVISADQADTLLSMFLNTAVKASQCEIIKDIIFVFDNTRMNVNVMPVLNSIFLNPLLTREVVQWILSCYPQKKGLDFLVEVVNLGDDDTAVKLAEIISTYFPNITEDEWKLLVSLTDDFEDEEYDNQKLRAFFQAKLAGICVFAEIPEWVKEIEIKEIQPVPNYIPQVNDAVNMLLKDISQEKASSLVDEKKLPGVSLREFLRVQYSVATIANKIDMLSSVMKMLPFDDTAIFNEYGPVNTRLTTSNIQTKCDKYGGCRMLTCIEFETCDLNGEEIDIMSVDNQGIIVDWFRGSCDDCGKRISSKECAVRKPLKNGGWRGCYCSFDCLEAYIEDNIDAMMINIIEDQLYRLGIRKK